MSDLELLARLGLTVLLCGLVGLERESRDQAAGLRTHILVGVGAALFTLVSAYGFQDVLMTNPDGKPVMRDPTRIAAQVVSGIGFLGAGAIMRQGFTVRGLTTAATLWMSAAIGMAAAAGFYAGAVVASVISIAALIIFRKLRPHFMPRLRSDWVVLELDLADTKTLGRVMGLLMDNDVKVQGMNSASDEDDEGQQVRLEIRVPAHFQWEVITDQLDELPKVRSWNADGFHAPE